jgi:hypothetical protein
MAPSKDFERALHEALSAMAPLEEGVAANGCPEPETLACHVRGTRADDTVERHISSCATCSEFAADVKRRQKLYERQKVAFTKMAQEKYPKVPVLRETFRPFAWMLTWKALVPELALAAAIIIAAFNFNSVSPPDAGRVTVHLNAEAKSAASTIAQIERSDAKRPADTAVLLEKFRAQPELVGHIDAARIEQARLVVGQKKAAVADDPALADQWSSIEGKLQGYEFIARYYSLRRQADRSAIPGKVADVEGKNGNVTISLDRDPTTDRQGSRLLRTSAVETRGLNQIIILTPQGRWQMSSKDDFEVAASVNSQQTKKP